MTPEGLGIIVLLTCLILSLILAYLLNVRIEYSIHKNHVLSKCIVYRSVSFEQYLSDFSNTKAFRSPYEQDDTDNPFRPLIIRSHIDYAGVEYKYDGTEIKLNGTLIMAKNIIEFWCIRRYMRKYFKQIERRYQL